MATLKVTILMNFLGNPNCGFSESWVMTQGESNFQTAAIDLANSRRQSLSRNWYVAGVRAGKLVVRQRPSPASTYYLGQELVQLPCSTFGPNAVGQLGPSDTPWTAVFVRITTTRLPGSPIARPRLFQMRGVPDDLWVGATFNKNAANVQLGPFLQRVTGNVGALAAGHPYIITPPAVGDSAGVNNYEGYCIDRASSRRIGRPFGLLRGRQSEIVTA